MYTGRCSALNALFAGCDQVPLPAQTTASDNHCPKDSRGETGSERDMWLGWHVGIGQMGRDGHGVVERDNADREPDKLREQACELQALNVA